MLVLPAIAVEALAYRIGEDEVYQRPAGGSLQPKRDSIEAIEALKREVGSRVFARAIPTEPHAGRRQHDKSGLARTI